MYKISDNGKYLVVGKELVSLKFDELERITEYILEVYPPHPIRCRTALVSSPGLTAAFLAVWAESAEALPYDVQTFSDLKTAEEWILDVPVA